MLGAGLVVLYFALAFLAAAIILQSDRFEVRRSASIGADPAKLFELVANPAHWRALGAVRVVESQPNTLVVMELALGKSDGELRVGLRPDGADTIIDCVVAGRNSIVDRIRNFFGDREKVVGPRVEQALADIAASA